MLKRIGAGAMLAGTFTMLAGFAAAPVMAQGISVPDYPGADELPEMRFSITQSESPSSSFGQAAQVFADYVTAASKGKITFEIFWSSALMGPTEVPDGLASGLVDLGGIAPSYDPAAFPMGNWLTQLAGQSRGPTPYAQLTFAMAQWEMAMTDPQLVKSFEDRGIKILGGTALDGYSLLCKEPIRTLEDARGKRVRTAGVVFANEAQALGMVPVPLLPTEIYEGFSRGIVDCVMHTPTGYINYGITEVDGPKFFINSSFAGFTGSYWAMAKSKWDTLTPLAQQIMLDGFAAYALDFATSDLKQLARFNEMVQSGKITAVDAAEDFKAALRAHQDAEIERMIGVAPADVQNPREVVERFLALIKKWQGIAGEMGFEAPAGDLDGRMASWTKEYDFTPITARIREEIAKALPN